MKRFIVLVLAAMMLLLCSCGADVGKETETTPINASAAVMRRECRRFLIPFSYFPL
jgi:hypothetical protein